MVRVECILFFAQLHKATSDRNICLPTTQIAVLLLGANMLLTNERNPPPGYSIHGLSTHRRFSSVSTSGCCAKILFFHYLYHFTVVDCNFSLRFSYIMGNLPALPASLQPLSPTKYEVHSFQYSASDNHSKELFILTIKFCAKAS